MRPVVLSQAGSMNSRHTPESIAPPQFIKARNCRLHDDEIAPRPGSTLILGDPYNSNADLMGIGSFRDSGEKDVVVVMNSDGNLWGTNPYPGDPVGSAIPVAGSMTAVLAVGNYLKLEAPAFPLTAGNYMDTTAAYGRIFMTFSDNLIGVGNGIRQLRFDSVTRRYRYTGLGLQPSGTAAIYAASTTVGDIAQGIRYAIVLFETETGYISGYTTVAIGKAIITANGFSIDVSGIPIHPDGHVTKRIIAFTQSGASSEGPYFYIPEDAFIEGLIGPVDGNGNNITKTVLDNNTATAATFNFPDEFLLGGVDVTAFLDKTVPSVAKSIFYSKTLRRLITCGEDNSTFRFSEVDDPETFMASTGLMKPGEGDAGSAMCAREWRSSLYMLRNTGAYIAQATDVTPAEWGASQAWTQVGPEGPWAVDVSAEYIAFAHRSGPYLFKGDAPEWIGYEITGNKDSDFPNWDQINWDYAHLIYVTIDPIGKLIKFGVPLNDSTKVNVELIVDYTNGWKMGQRKWSYDDVNSTRTIYARRPLETRTQMLVASNAVDGKLLFEDENSFVLDGGAAFNQQIRWGFTPPQSVSGIYSLNFIDIKCGGNGNIGILLYGSEDENPRTLEMALPGFIKEVHKGVVGSQNEQWSVEVTNKNEPGNYFRLQKVSLELVLMWENRITS